MNKNATQGIIYFAIGEKYIEEFKISYRSLLDHMPETNVSLITNCHVDITGINTIVYDFKKTESLLDNLLNKIKAFQLSPS